MSLLDHKVFDCYNCENEITNKNSSVEHIIPNAIGGKLKSRYLLCSTCNALYGNTIDKELAKSVKELCNFLMIDRDNGAPQRIKGVTKSGESFYMEVGGTPVRVKPEIEEIKTADLVNLKFTAGYEEQYKTIAKGFIKKYPQLTMEDFNIARSIKDEYMVEPLHFELHVGGPKVFRAIAKIAVNLFIMRGGGRKYISNLIPFINGELDESEAKNFVWLHYPENPMHNFHEEEVSHIVQIVGNPEQKLIYAFVELFSNQSFVVKLNENYDGPSVDITYGYDLLRKEEIPVLISKKYEREEFLNLFIVRDLVDRGPRPFLLAQERLQRVMGIAEKRLISLQISRIAVKTIKAGFKFFPNDVEKRTEFIKAESEKEVIKFINSRFKSTMD